MALYHPRAGRGGGPRRVTLLARGARPPGRAQAPAADVVAGGVVVAAARLAAVLAVPVLLARFRGSEVGTRVNTGTNYGVKAPTVVPLVQEKNQRLTDQNGPWLRWAACVAGFYGVTRRNNVCG